MNPFVNRTARIGASLLAASTPLAHGADGLRVATWNITFYEGGRTQQLQTAIYGEWNGSSMDPDVICLQEMMSRTAVNAIVEAANTAPNSPGDWVAAPVFLTGGTTNALVYRSSKLLLIETELVSQGGRPPLQPRNVVRYDFRPVGYTGDGSILSIFPQHFKAKSGAENDVLRETEAQTIVDHIATLPADRAIILGADLNIHSAGETAYKILNGTAPNTGPLRDPISRAANWNNNQSFRMIHTQDPTSSAGMDDRLDQLLLTTALIDGRGMDYDGEPTIPWDLSRYDDPNHSLRAWGNDGTSYNTTLRVQGNTMVGPVIAQALKDMADPDGHLPVFLDLDMPGRLGLQSEKIDAGTIPFNGEGRVELLVSNTGDTALWGPGGIATLHYALSTDSPAVTLPSRPFEARADAPAATHGVTISGGSFEPGPNAVAIRVTSDDPGRASVDVLITFDVAGCSAADMASPLGSIDFFDVARFLDFFAARSPEADLAAPFGQWNFFDLSEFIRAFGLGCAG